ncbi:hypothetical protein SAMN05443253_11515 [Bacillus sp. OK048]|nr:hypothetical protein SAMN05443253_11515 [Bacillus sp. OK048]
MTSKEKEMHRKFIDELAHCEVKVPNKYLGGVTKEYYPN